MKKLLFLGILLTLFLPSRLLNAQESNQGINAGFVQGIWYSSFPFFEGDTVRIYAAFQNQSEQDVTATVEFYNNDSKIGSMPISIVSGRLAEAWVDWTFTKGSHTVSARITNPQKNEIGQPPTPIVLAFDATTESLITVDIDTDHDNIGDAKDTDDDNDGISDAEEIEQASDPLDPGSPPKEPASTGQDSELTSLDQGTLETTSFDKTDISDSRFTLPEPLKDTSGALFETSDGITEKLIQQLEQKRDLIAAQIPASEAKKAPEDQGSPELKKLTLDHLSVLLLNTLIILLKFWPPILFFSIFGIVLFKLLHKKKRDKKDYD